MAEPDLDRAGDGLYALPLEEFVPARNELAKRLKKDGDTEGAAEVASRRKPTLVAWAVDQLAHTRRREVDLLLDAGKRLVDAQQASMSKGSRTELDAAQASLRKSVASLTDAAGKILGTRASTSTLARVAETLRAAATVAEGRELLARGCLVEELSDTGWDLVAALTPASATGAALRTTGRSRRGADAGADREGAEGRARPAHSSGCRARARAEQPRRSASPPPAARRRRQRSGSRTRRRQGGRPRTSSPRWRGRSRDTRGPD